MKAKIPFKMQKIIFFPRFFFIKKQISVPTLRKVFRPIIRNTLFYLALGIKRKHTVPNLTVKQSICKISSFSLTLISLTLLTEHF